MSRHRTSFHISVFLLCSLRCPPPPIVSVQAEYDELLDDSSDEEDRHRRVKTRKVRMPKERYCTHIGVFASNGTLRACARETKPLPWQVALRVALAYATNKSSI